MTVRARCIALAGLLLPGLLAAAPEPPASSVDHIYALTGTWTCRTLRGAETRHVGTRTGDMLDVVNDVRPAAGRPYTLDDRYIFDPAAGMWHVRFLDRYRHVIAMQFLRTQRPGTGM